jgi:sigma-54 dependent transcriptional regulator, acetoin dehydrogenase operon transcriptional activator AcoR
MGHPLNQTDINTHFYSQKDIDKAWDNFLCSGGNSKNLPVRDLIASSWERCLSQGVNPEQKAAPLIATEGSLHILRQKNTDLMKCARPVLAQARVFLRDLDTILILTDYNGVNLDIVGDPKCVEDAVDIGMVPGSGWKEIVCGSNAIGTAMATGLPTQVHGEEHFIQGFKPWTCTAGIISDPYDNQLIGVIDVSGLSNTFDKFHVPLVVSWANQIQLLLAKGTSEQWNIIRENSHCDFNNSQRNAGKLLFDTQGRLIDHSQNACSILNSLGIDYDLASKPRLSFEKFGGESIIYPHDEGLWLSGDWIEPVNDKNEVVGFKIQLPLNKRLSQQVDKHSNISTSKTSLNTNPFVKISGQSESIKASIDKARKAASTPLPVLLLGDTGVGKEMFARAIHETSNFSDGPFIDLNCGAFTKDILSSELFGHVEGSFTGAKKGGMMGKIEAANGGTLFLDEVGEMPLEIQPIFLRVLQERKIHRVGAIAPIQVNFRLIAATNSQLKKEVAEGRFRKDLFFRLSTVAITIDPLSKRIDDIEEIALLILNEIQRSQDIMPKRISAPLFAALKNREWPGNIRELVNVIECMCYMSSNETLTTDDLPAGYQPGESLMSATPNTELTQSSETRSNLDIAEQQTIEIAIREFGGNITQAAKNLGIAKGTLYRKMKKYNLDNPR